MQAEILSGNQALSDSLQWLVGMNYQCSIALVDIDAGWLQVNYVNTDIVK